MNKYLAASEAELLAVGKIMVTVKGMSIGLYNVDGAYYAWRNVCPHAGAPVCEGNRGGTTLPSAVYEYEFGMDNCIIRCPWHGWEFNLTNGQHLVNAKVKLRGFEVTVENGSVYLLL